MSKQSTYDKVYSKPRDMIVDFAFDDAVVKVFPDMIRRSVPGYAEIITLTGLLAEQYVQPESRCYDLGCSLGAATLSMRQRIPSDCTIVAIDNSQAMIDTCRQQLGDNDKATVELYCQDIQDADITNASMVVLNFTLQFIEANERLSVLQKIYKGLRPGGLLVLSEKLNFSDVQEQQMQEAMQLSFKRANGYSDMEISQKRSALEKVLIPDTFEQHQQRLQTAGFAQVYQWFQAFNFVSIAAIK
ncbi:MAG: carboxy-S-adenosyl-L-methionine synthase CmoA [Gammaproteobacteria bacterium]|nr:carboxy-S-adenosyl-L-methionine synthase CmoA [Gammaproteobacteria bacterium]